MKMRYVKDNTGKKYGYYGQFLSVLLCEDLLKESGSDGIALKFGNEIWIYRGKFKEGESNNITGAYLKEEGDSMSVVFQIGKLTADCPYKKITEDDIFEEGE